MLAATFLAGFSSEHAQSQSLDVVTIAYGGNYYAPGNSVSTTPLETSGGSLSNTFNFTGLDRSGAAGTMSFVVNANAIATYGSLGASFSSTLSNAIYNADNIEWVTNSEGVPNFFDGQSDASFADTVTVEGGPGLSSIKLMLQLNGTMSELPNGGSGYVALWYQLSGGGETTFLNIHANAGSATTIHETVTTPAFTVSAQGTANVYLLLQTYGEWDLYDNQIADHQTLSESVDFIDTVGITQIQGFNASGQTVALTSAVGSSGTTYAVTPPPPPLNLQIQGQAVILNWNNPAFSLQAAPTLTGAYTNIPNATSPFTNLISGSQRFFRLLGPP
jgi:hypothetical protein